jgi:hypothetical protein
MPVNKVEIPAFPFHLLLTAELRKTISQLIQIKSDLNETNLEIVFIDSFKLDSTSNQKLE